MQFLDVTLRQSAAKVRQSAKVRRKCGRAVFLYLWGFQVFALADGAAVLLRARKFRPRFRVFSVGFRLWVRPIKNRNAGATDEIGKHCGTPCVLLCQ